MSGRMTEGRSTAGLPNDRQCLRGVRRWCPFSACWPACCWSRSVALNFANVVGRYFFNASIYWAEEVMLFLMVGCVFLGNGVVAWSGRQIRMDVIVGMMPEKVREVLKSVLRADLHRVAVTIVVFAWPVIRDLWNSTSAASPPSCRWSIRRSMIPIGLSIMVFLVVIRLLTGGERGPSRGRGTDQRDGWNRGTQHRC